MKGAYYTMDDAYKIANYDGLLEENKKLKEENAMLKSDNYNLKNIVKEKDKHYLPIITEKNKRLKELEKELYDKNNKQISMEEC